MQLVEVHQQGQCSDEVVSIEQDAETEHEEGNPFVPVDEDPLLEALNKYEEENCDRSAEERITSSKLNSEWLVTKIYILGGFHIVVSFSIVVTPFTHGAKSSFPTSPAQLRAAQGGLSCSTGPAAVHSSEAPGRVEEFAGAGPGRCACGVRDFPRCDAGAASACSGTRAGVRGCEAYLFF